MKQRIGIVLFDEAEELDFVGPWEVFTMAARTGQEVEVVSVAQEERPVRCAKGMRVLPDLRLDAAGDFDIVLVPGGQGTRREVSNPVLIEWLRKTSARCSWVTSVCTGALLLCEAGLARGRKVTTHWAFVADLRARYPDVEVREQVRYVRDGNLVTAAGVSAGIDMALWLCGQLWGVEVARKTQRAMEYDPAPPYAADV
ncbi:MAG TPA: DJ-1/PfpI family protein [Myxococcota bacterium]|nr:DJ-1/PfpI family protein [Myxococcota bacterium]